jgi:uncharacterized protein (TIGR03089 family)
VTFPDLLERLRAGGTAAPFLTWYAEPTADSQAERIELSVATYTNWVAKTSSLLAEEFDLERGDYVLVDLPAHWLVPIFAAAAWNLGAGVVTPETADGHPVRLRVCGPAGLPANPAELPTLACSLHPLGLRFSTDLPIGVRDFGVEVWGQPDAFLPFDPPEPSDPATATATQADLFGRGSRLSASGRVLTDAHLLGERGLRLLIEAMETAGSLVLTRGADAIRQAELARVEHAQIAPG